jgi:hypothetical protein
VPPVQDSYTTYDNTAKNNVTYTYFVTGSLVDGRQSPPSTAVVAPIKF